jgi:hypothetical protein
MIADVHVAGRDHIKPTFRVPLDYPEQSVRIVEQKVELRGIEPLTSSMPCSQRDVQRVR